MNNLLFIIYVVGGLISPLIAKNAIGNSADFNSITNYGIYAIYTKTTNNINSPANDINYGILIAYGHSESNQRVGQIVFDVFAGRIFMRRLFDTWSPWKQI